MTYSSIFQVLPIKKKFHERFEKLSSFKLVVCHEFIQIYKVLQFFNDKYQKFSSNFNKNKFQ